MESNLPKRIVVIGNSCAGKTTFSTKLAKLLNTKHIELDALFWEPNWVEANLETFRSRVASALQSDSWIVDGSYRGRIKDLVWPKADTIIWLDPTLTTILQRFFLRSFKRTLTREKLWQGCQESLRNSIFRRDSLLAWILKTYRKRADEYAKLVTNPPAGVKVHQFRNNKDVENFLLTIRHRDTFVLSRDENQIFS